MSTAVALIESPFQLVSLMEARRAGAVPEHVTMLLRGDAARSDVLLSIVDRDSSAPLRRLVEPSLSRAVTLARAADHLILGDVLSGFGHVLVVTLRGRRVTILDDGASTIHAVEMLRLGGVLARPRDVVPARRRPLVQAATHELRRLGHVGRLDWCTGLDGVAPEPAFAVARHSFEWSASVTVPVHLIGRSRVVLGSSLASDGLIEEARYHEWLQKEIRPGRTLFFPHRREHAETLRFVRDSGAATVSMRGLPIELVARDLGDGVRFSSLPSTAALTIPRVRRRTRVCCTKVPDEWWNPQVPLAFRSLLDAVADATSSSDAAFERRRRA